MNPYALDRMVPPAPWETARDRYAELATEDRPGSPYQIPFDPRPRRSSFVIVTAAQLIACALFAGLAWSLLS